MAERGDGGKALEPGSNAQKSAPMPSGWRARHARQRRALWFAALVACVTGSFAYAFAGLTQRRRPVVAASEALAQELRDRRQAALRDYVNDELGDWTGWAVQNAGAKGGPAAGWGSGEVAPVPRHANAQTQPNKAGAARQLPPTPYEKLYGRAARYALAARSPLGASAQGLGTGSGAQGRQRVRGMVLQARLLNEVASNPTNGSVLAALTTPAKLGDVALPVGTQVHGVVRGSGNSDTRVFVDFSFVRLAGGESYSLKATAADLQGRDGVPGKKSLTSAAAGSVALFAASSAGQAAGQTLASGLGAILGAGVQGATSSGGQKATRLDQDDYVVLVSQGTPIRIYVAEFNPAT